jgi:hypothetical protein
MKTYYHTFQQKKDGTKEYFLTLELKNKEKNGILFVLFNSRWHKVKYRETIVDGLPRYRRNYIGPISTYLQNEIVIKQETPVKITINA